jgi:transcriptional regulator with XRE-family HTH domain
MVRAMLDAFLAGARALFGWNQAQLAEAAGLSVGQVKNVERGAQDPRASTLAALERALFDAGVVVLDRDDTRGRGIGVRFRDR